MKKNKNKIKNKCDKNEIKEIWQDDKFDPNGSYVGTGALEGTPVQDADDL